MMDHEHDGGLTPSENNQSQPPIEQGDIGASDAPVSGERAVSREHSTSASSPSTSAHTSFGQRVRNVFSRESLREFGRRVHWPWIRSSSVGWLVAVVAAALFIQAVGLYNMLAVADEKQQWDASSTQRANLEGELATILDRKATATQELVAAKAALEHEQTRLAELRAALKIDQALRDEAQREYATATAKANQLNQQNETLAARLKDLGVRLDTTERTVSLQETKRDALLKDVEASQAILAEHRGEVAKATKACQDLDKQAFDTLAAIRTTRESLVKAQSELDAAVRETAKAEAQRDAALTRLKNAELLEADATKRVAQLKQQAATIEQSLVMQAEKLESLTAAKTKADASLASLQTDLERANKALAESQGKLAATKTHVDEATAAQSKLKAEQAALQAALQPLRDEQSQLATDIAVRKQELQSLLDQIDANTKKAIDSKKSSSNAGNDVDKDAGADAAEGKASEKTGAPKPESND